MPTARVIWFSENRGFGLLEPDAGGEPVYLLWEHLPAGRPKEIKEGSRVSYAPAKRGNVLIAVDVQILPK